MHALRRGIAWSRFANVGTGPSNLCHSAGGCFAHASPQGFTGIASQGRLMDVMLKDILGTRVAHLCYLVDKVGNPSMFRVRTAIAQHIQ
jgi:hypothetical protein